MCEEYSGFDLFLKILLVEKSLQIMKRRLHLNFFQPLGQQDLNHNNIEEDNTAASPPSDEEKV